MKLLRAMVAGVVAILALANTPARADESYPSRIVKIIVGFPAGSSADILGRVYAQRLGEVFKQTFIVENRAGASSNIAAEYAVRSAPDGYTIVIGSTANTISTNTLSLKFDFAKDLSPIIAFANGPVVLMVSSTLGINSVKDFVTYAKARPGKVMFGSSGTYSGPHMAGELFSQVTGADLSFVPYQGVPAAISDMLGGQIPSVFATSPTAASFVADDRVKLLAVMADKRSDLIPDVPTMREAGIEGADTSIWYGFFAPAGTPLEIRTKLADAIAKINELPDVQEALARNGARPMAVRLDDLGKYVIEDTARWKAVAQSVKEKQK
jgi:tripartite-type tricarboxylate transporter receptor subunit TctC